LKIQKKLQYYWLQPLNDKICTWLVLISNEQVEPEMIVVSSLTWQLVAVVNIKLLGKSILKLILPVTVL
jgi:hypothetical protein